ncbi:hypothetical protein [Haloferax mucosum]|nr:hypothetical protein [Haloferax mucosum]
MRTRTKLIAALTVLFVIVSAVRSLGGPSLPEYEMASDGYSE